MRVRQAECEVGMRVNIHTEAQGLVKPGLTNYNISEVSARALVVSPASVEKWLHLFSTWRKVSEQLQGAVLLEEIGTEFCLSMRSRRRRRYWSFLRDWKSPEDGLSESLVIFIKALELYSQSIECLRSALISAEEVVGSKYVANRDLEYKARILEDLLNDPQECKLERLFQKLWDNGQTKAIFGQVTDIFRVALEWCTARFNVCLSMADDLQAQLPDDRAVCRVEKILYEIGLVLAGIALWQQQHGEGTRNSDLSAIAEGRKGQTSFVQASCRTIKDHYRLAALLLNIVREKASANTCDILILDRVIASCDEHVSKCI